MQPSFSTSFTFDRTDWIEVGNGVGSVRAGDMDGDGAPDIVGIGGRNIFILSNKGSCAPWTISDDLDSTGQCGQNGAELFDVDGDGHLDIVGAKKDGDPGWWENPGPPLTNVPWNYHRLGTGFNGWFMHDLVASDLNQDGLTNEFVAVFQSGYWDAPVHVVWFRPQVDPYQDWEKHYITQNQAGPNNNHAGVDTGDIDLDGDIDIAFCNGWFESPGDPGGSWTWHEVTTIYGVSNTQIRDVDNDEKPDLVMSAGHHGQGVYWFRNAGNPLLAGNWTLNNISAVQGDIFGRRFYDGLADYLHHPEGLQVADLDDDGDQDILCSELFFGEDPGEPGWTSPAHNLYIFEHLGTSPPQWARQNISPDSWPSHLPALHDMDEDGRLDILTEGPGINNISYLRNTTPGLANPTNQVPLVDAGTDTVLVIPTNSVDLIGNVFSGSPPGPPNVQWTVDSGPGTVFFVNSTAAVTTAVFSEIGSYLLRLTADNGFQTACDIVQVSLKRPDNALQQILYWPLNEGSGTLAGDASSSANDGTIQSGSWTSGHEGTAIQFDGAATFISRADAQLNGEFPAKSAAAQDFTVAAWIRISGTGQYQPIAGKQASGQRGFQFAVSTQNKLLLEVYKDQSQGSIATSAMTLQQNQFYHVAATYEFVTDGSSRIRLYVDGLPEGSSDSAPGPLIVNSAPFEVGRYNWSGAFNPEFAGVVDGVRVFNRHLSQSEIQSQMIPEFYDFDQDQIPDDQDPDDDNDGLPDTWEKQHGLNAWFDDTGHDPDLDGYLNVEEYIANTAPRIDSERPEILSIKWAVPGADLTFQSSTDRLYSLTYAEDLEQPEWGSLMTDFPATGTSMRVNDPSGGPHKYYRLGVRLPP